MKLRIGILGTASIAERLVIPSIIELKEYYSNIIIASRNEEKAVAFANKFNIDYIVGYENLIEREDIDVIYLPLPIGLHFEWAMKSLEAKKHLLVEKSFTINNEQTNIIIEKARSNNLLVMENFMFKYHKQHEKVWEILNNKILGDIKLFRSQFGFPPLTKNDIRYNYELGGGSLLDAGAYTIMASRWFFGNNQKVISSNLIYDHSNKVDIGGAVTLLSKNGIVSQNTFGFDNFYKCNYEIWGSKGYLYNKKAFTPKKNENIEIILETQNEIQSFSDNEDNHFKNILYKFYILINQRIFDSEYLDILDQSNTISEVFRMSNK